MRGTTEYGPCRQSGRILWVNINVRANCIAGRMKILFFIRSAIQTRSCCPHFSVREGQPSCTARTHPSWWRVRSWTSSTTSGARTRSRRMVRAATRHPQRNAASKANHFSPFSPPFLLKTQHQTAPPKRPRSAMRLCARHGTCRTHTRPNPFPRSRAPPTDRHPAAPRGQPPDRRVRGAQPGGRERAGEMERTRLAIFRAVRGRRSCAKALA